MTDDRAAPDLAELARRVYRGDVFTSLQVPEWGEPMMVFPVIGFMTLEDRTRLAQTCGMVYEEIAKAGPRTVNGLPMFFSCRYLTIAQTEEFIRLYGAIVRAVEAEIAP